MTDQKKAIILATYRAIDELIEKGYLEGPSSLTPEGAIELVELEERGIKASCEDIGNCFASLRAGGAVTIEEQK